jgi:hypothetical protein
MWLLLVSIHGLTHQAAGYRVDNSGPITGRPGAASPCGDARERRTCGGIDVIG